ncbi:DUF1097 domain-containing protein [Pseudobutyrivibrio sp.]|jgi:hypothetical protein|uniref:DUF1097 domain-containing protein n=1 Tax=Pseudobutyrivibrio sp. TaxID=2014367 RepID=UPI001D6454E2|nr:DUF1097 domain-containing protein [Pseudobutyrivibrio sp.]MBE5910293.1 DUF1097 domain-containing protein [Pseudobutyrivibrio sp.]
MKEKWLNILTLAFTVAFLPPIWAVASTHVGVTVGAVALICAGLFAALGNNIKLAIPVSLGFLCGDVWAVIATKVMASLGLGPDLTVYVTLFVMGGLAVIIGSVLEKFIFVPAWLAGWAIGLTIMGPMDASNLGTMPIQIGAAMLAGVWYVGVVGDLFQKLLIKIFNK